MRSLEIYEESRRVLIRILRTMALNLTWLTFLPLLTAGIVLLIPSRNKGLIKFISVVGTVITFIMATGLARMYMEAEANPEAATGISRSADVMLREVYIPAATNGLSDELRAKVEAVVPKTTEEYKALEAQEGAIAALETDLGAEGFKAWGEATELTLALDAEQATTLRFVELVPWLKPFNINYFMAVDGLSMPLVWLTALLGVLCLVYSWTIDKGTKAYFVLFLFLETGLIGVFCALDFFLFYVFWEVVLLPMYFLIGIWGGPNRIYAAIKFFIYTLVGSVLMLLAMLVMYFWYEPHTFNMLTLMQLGPEIPLNAQLWLFMGIFIAFAIKVPIFPFHTWLPDAHVEAPTAVSVVLAGVLLKMGGYGLFRIAYPMLNDAATHQGIVYMVAILGVINIVYGAFCALAQTDFKKLVAYSSVSHMGYVLLGMAAMSYTGVNGAVLQMFTHGISSAMLFLVVGVIYDRAHHRDLNDFGGIATQMPWYTGIATVGFFASLGLPGLCGFISEALTFVGAWDGEGLINSDGYTGSSIDSQWMVWVSLLGVVLGAAYILWTIQRVYLGKLQDKYKNFKDVSLRELIALVPLGVLCIVVGVFPQWFILDHIQPSLKVMTDMIRSALPVVGAGG